MRKDYVQLFQNALINEKIFNTFKGTYIFNSITGPTQPSYAAQAYNKIFDDKVLIEMLPTFIKNDSIGHPHKIMTGHGLIGCDTLRFIEDLKLMKDQWSSLGSVFEYGSSYGALAHMILNYFKPSLYVVHDLPEVQQLCLKYLQALGNDMSKVTTTPTQCDTFISEYGWSERPMVEMQSTYEQWMKNAQRLFLRFNVPDIYNARVLKNFIERDFANVIVEKEPKYRHPNEVILAWK